MKNNLRVERTGKLTGVDIHVEIELLANRLAQIHGGARIAKEKNGTIIYIPSPHCLEHYGLSEIYKKHLAIVVDWYMDPEHSNPNCGFCMKSNVRYNIEDLLNMTPVNERGYKVTETQKKVTKSDSTKYLEYDEDGNLVPTSPGDVIPIHECLDTNPGVQYLLKRGYDLTMLWQHMRVSFCTKENPKVPYGWQPEGFRKTPQGRIIFYIDQFGVNRGWQGRILETVDNNLKYFWHPYKEVWVPVEEKTKEGFKPLPGYDGWNPGKYIIGMGTSRNDVLLGFDAAVKYNEGKTTKTLILTEGPLDAAKIGPPAVAVMGKWVSEGQAALASNSFNNIIIIPDNDRGGQDFLNHARRSLGVFGVAPKVIELPENVNDVGTLTIEDAQRLIKEYV